MIASHITKCTLFAAIITLVGGQAVLFPSQSEFAASETPGLPSFSVRANNVTAAVCNSSTPGVSGFIDTPEDDSHVFFWLFESKNDFSKDPIIFFMSGGPGASSTGFGNLMELGPCRVTTDGSETVDNPYGWNTNATVLFVDQPIPVGFSYGKTMPKGLAEASNAMDRFLRQFFLAFPALVDQDFYIAGESYGGSWVPALAANIVERQTRSDSQEGAAVRYLGMQRTLATARPRDINIKGIMIGNGLVKLPIQNPATLEAACSGPDSILNSSQCLEWAPRSLWCEQNLVVCDSRGWLSDDCKHAQSLCNEMSDLVTGEMGRNPFDWRRDCHGDALSCYPELAAVVKYLDRGDVKKGLGVPADKNFTGVSQDLYDQWEAIGDLWKPSDHYVNYLLDKNYRVLIYVGDKDWYCHAAGMRQLVNHGLVWNGQPLFRFRELTPWYSGVKVAGRGKAFQALTYAEVYGAGHLVPYDRPAASLALINAWVSQTLPW
ncbi:PRC1-Carboxypeptidase y, serine-type protease [Fusarium fujikuroi]|nr:PRC1-Carboxypeptidase y, serine-type protease [Fusarium fujikuroi]QGI70614.1 hypothetical protein CEK27_002943 [Fusarium fujikuroi]QGI87959.1 hypothetical protein CEK25_002915 [Fusarium fujikuroi]SCN89602.1 PRC1-Carboxypeptidase y, serine-type protease [Fusarium fujikuroi]SCO16402.1 PRC1-Carboxypeptidase y, serine-type protease [Fusarium fujikuroi]